ncbi:MAG: S-layer homology domain-containing protein, partial [Eubacteriales bacterium]|nr:S-layer homology domain-containing protein [Eubacteriales bacterium]
NGAPLYGAQAELLIDTSKWEFVGEDESAVTVFNDFKAGVIESDSGIINKIKLIYVNPDQNNPGTITDSSLKIGQITLKAIAKGTSEIALSEYKVTKADGDPLSNVSAEPMKITITSGSSGGSTAPGTPVNENPIVSKDTDAAGTATIKASDIKEAKTLTVNGNTKVDNAVLEFDAKAVEMIKAAGSDDVKVNLSKVESSKLTEEQKTQMASLIEEDTMKDRPVYSFNVTVGDEKVSDFKGGKVSISLDYKLKLGEDPEKIVIFHLKNDGTIEVLKNCKYDVRTGKLSFNVGSFSYFVVGYTDELKATFTDVPLNAWYYESVYYLANKNIVKGRTETTFAPMQNITRAEFLQILYGITKPNDNDFKDPAYTDASKDAWYYNAVAWGTKEGVVAGSGGKFRPNDNVSRQEMAVMLNQFTDKVAKTKLNKASEAISFTDASNIASWAGSSVETMQQSGIISGFACDTGFRFAPAENATRAQAARMVAELLKQLEK